MVCLNSIAARAAIFVVPAQAFPLLVAKRLAKLCVGAIHCTRIERHGEQLGNQKGPLATLVLKRTFEKCPWQALDWFHRQRQCWRRRCGGRCYDSSRRVAERFTVAVFNASFAAVFGRTNARHRLDEKLARPSGVSVRTFEAVVHAIVRGRCSGGCRCALLAGKVVLVPFANSSGSSVVAAVQLAQGFGGMVRKCRACRGGIALECTEELCVDFLDRVD